MKRVTRNSDPASARDLLERDSRACLCFASEQGPQAQPVGVVWQDGHYLAGLSRQAEQRPGSGQEVVLLIDEGIHFFDLRALYIRGLAKTAEVPPQAPAADWTWFEVVPLKIVSWDYGALREVSDER